MFLTIYTWRKKKFKQNDLLRAIGITDNRIANQSIISSVSANLNAGVKSGLYVKEGIKENAQYSLSPKFMESKEFKNMKFIPSKIAICSSQQRARNLAEKKKK